MRQREKVVIKVCGMRDHDNLMDLAKLDVDWIGHIFYEKSKRNVNPLELLPKIVGKKQFGVFVNESMERVLQIIADFKLSGVQLHGDEDANYCKDLKSKFDGVILKAFGIDEGFEWSELHVYTSFVDYFVFDTKGPSRGGNGYQFDWTLLQNYHFDTPFLLSGGIGPEHISALKNFSHSQWVGVDLNSCFEDKPGVKNIDQIKMFVDEIRN